MNTQEEIVKQQTELLEIQQKRLRFYETRLEMIRLEAEAELKRIEHDGGLVAFAKRIELLAECSP